MTAARQVWREGEGDYDECAQPELLGTFYRKPHAQALLMSASAAAYQDYLTENARQLAEAQRKAAKMTDFQVAYGDWEQAVRLAPTKALRITANEMLGFVRHMAPRPRLDTDWRQVIEHVSEHGSLAQTTWLERFGGGYYLSTLTVADA